MRRRSLWPLAVAPLLSLGARRAGAQRLTERFIPIGQSPGVSGKSTVLGTVGTFDGGSRTLTVQSAGGSQSVRLTESTRLWIDRSAERQPVADATPADLKPGWRVEVKFSADRSSADWVKLAPPAP